MLTRKKFLATGLVSISGGLLLPKFNIAQSSKPPPLDKGLVKQFVYEAHFSQENVEGMLEETPDLLNAVHNVGSWDWEDAVGAAAHMGKRDLALYLLSKGARMTICVAAGLGELTIVQSMIQAFPTMKNAKGPHNISMLQHAKYGGEHAVQVVEYLESIGIKE